MQMIITDAWVAKSRTIHLNSIKMVTVTIFFSVLLMLTSMGIYHLIILVGARPSLSFSSALEDVVLKDETVQRDRFMRENLNVLARRLGEMQAKIIQLESLGERISSLTGINTAIAKAAIGKGGALVLAHPMSMLEIETTISSLEQLTQQRSDSMLAIESQLFDKKMKGMMLPTGAPVERGVVGSSFGWRIDPISGQSALHTGLDFQADHGTPILASAGGVVVTQEFHPAYGNMLEIDHGDDLITRYAHAVKMVVKKGDLIRRGQFIGEVGTTGRSTGPHLHFEVLVNGIPQDPRKFLDAGRSVMTAHVIEPSSAVKR